MTRDFPPVQKVMRVRDLPILHACLTRLEGKVRLIVQVLSAFHFTFFHVVLFTFSIFTLLFVLRLFYSYSFYIVLLVLCLFISVFPTPVPTIFIY